MTPDLKQTARNIAERMTEEQRIDLIAQIYEIHLRALQPVDFRKQQCVPVPDWTYAQCQQVRNLL